jgi:starch synthase
LIALCADKRLRGRMCFLQGFNPELANRIYAAGDFFIVPSKYEPCGLTDFIAQLFGNIPVVHHVGGLVKIRDGITGIAYQGDTPEELLLALQRALALFADGPARRRMQQQAVEEIRQHYTWSKVMRKYLQLYREAKKTQICR